MVSGLNQEIFRSEVSETSEGRGYWLDRSWVDETQRAALIKASILAVPWVERDDNRPSFPTGTESFIARLGAMLDSPDSLRVAISGADYQELALHSQAWRLPTLLVSAVALPLVLNILANRLDELLPGHKADDTAELTLIVEGDHHKVLKFHYKGPARDVGIELRHSVDRFIDRIDSDHASSHAAKTHRGRRTP